MKPPPVKYARAGDLSEAIALLSEYQSDGKVLAGGQSLVPLLNFRLARPEVLIDINPVSELAYVREEPDSVLIGAATRQRDVETNALVRSAVPLVPLALSHVGHVTNRNRGTFGGSVAHADASSELPAVVLGLGGELVIAGKGGQRTVAAQDFFHGPFMTALADDELLIAVRLPKLPAGTGVAVEELARRHGDFAIAGAMAVIHRAGDGTADLVRLAAIGVDSVPVRLSDAEAQLLGSQITAAEIDAAVASVTQVINPTSDLHAPAEYRREMAGVLVRRAINRALEQSGPTS